MYIYKYQNIINNKVYIGQTSDLKAREYQHTYHAFKLLTKYPLYNAFRKYGKENFLLEILEECDNSLSNEKEIIYIQVYDSTNLKKGYNLRDGGGRKSLHASTKEKISRALKGNKNGIKDNFSPESLKLKSERAKKQLTGVTKSQEIKDKIRHTLKGRKPTKEANDKRIQTLKFNKKITESELKLVEQLITENNGKINISLLHRQTDTNSPRIKKIVRTIYGESGEPNS